MHLYGHQARGLFQEHGILVPAAEVTDSPAQARELDRGLGGGAAGLSARSVDVLVRLWQVPVREGAALVEVNPLVRTQQG